MVLHIIMFSCTATAADDVNAMQIENRFRTLERQVLELAELIVENQKIIKLITESLNLLDNKINTNAVLHSFIAFKDKEVSTLETSPSSLEQSQTTMLPNSRTESDNYIA